jgi:phage terminase large subunit-like protein
LGPVRCDGFRQGEPVGRPVRSPFIRNLATEENQAGNTYDNVRMMLTHLRDGGGGEFRGLDIGLTRVLWNKDQGEIRPSTAGAASKDGGKETFCVADEIHLYVLPELKAMHRTVMRNLAKRKIAEPWMLDTTTMYAIGELSVAETTMDDPPASILIDHREAPAVPDIYDVNADAVILEALAAVYGPAAEWMDLTRILEEMRDPEEAEADARRYFLNQRHETSNAYVNPDDWRLMADATEVVADGDFVVLGFDGATVDDATVLQGCRISDGHMFNLGVWQPADGLPVDRVAVDEAVRAAFDRFDVWRMYADPPHWQDEITRWESEFGEERIMLFWTNSRTAMGRALERFQTATRSHAFTHDGDSRIADHVGAARQKSVSGHMVIGKEHKRSKRKIDGAVASVLAWHARQEAVGAGAKPAKAKRRRVVSF